MGQMMALDPIEIEALAAKSNYPEYGISGRCNYITERGVRCLGLSGNKAQHADLTVELGFSSDMGVTNSRYPEEICEGQTQVNQGSMMGLSYDQLDVSTEEMENVDLYMQSLGVPARRNINDPQVIKGEQNFYKAKSLSCDDPAYQTTRYCVIKQYPTPVAGRSDHSPLFRLSVTRHGFGNYGSRPE